MLGLTTCSHLLISLFACSSGKVKLVAVLVLVLFTIVFLTWYDLTSYSIVLPVPSSAFFLLLWIIFIGVLYTSDLHWLHQHIFLCAFKLQLFQLYFWYFTIVFLTWHDLIPYSIALPVSISALVFRLWSICFRCIMNEGYLGYFIRMKVYRVCTSFY